MYRIITYGLRYADFGRQRELFSLRNNGNIEILGEVAFEAEDEEIFFCRMSLEEAVKISPDLVLVCETELEYAIEKYVKR